MQHPRPIISILTVTNLIAMCGRLRVGKKFLHVCRLVISTATATAMFPALDAAPVVACTKAMPCNAQPSSPSNNAGPSRMYYPPVASPQAYRYLQQNYPNGVDVGPPAQQIFPSATTPPPGATYKVGGEPIQRSVLDDFVLMNRMMDDKD